MVEKVGEEWVKWSSVDRGNLGDWDQVWGLEALGLMTKQIFKRI